MFQINLFADWSIRGHNAVWFIHCGVNQSWKQVRFSQKSDVYNNSQGYDIDDKLLYFRTRQAVSLFWVVVWTFYDDFTCKLVGSYLAAEALALKLLTIFTVKFNVNCVRWAVM